MPRIRLSTTVDASLLEHARSVRVGTTDAALVDEALAALLARHRSAEIDESYAAYDQHPLDEPDEGGSGVVPAGRSKLVRALPARDEVLVNRLSRLRDARMREICAALAVAVECSG